MKFQLILSSALTVSATAIARPGAEPQGHQFQHPKPLDRRSPCPGLNALANHGWLPRSGQDIGLVDVQQAIEGAYNFGHGVLDQAVAMVFAANLSTTANYNTTFNLNDLASRASHGTNEFDGSLSRSDFLLGDSLHFDHKVWDPVAKNLGLCNSRSGKFVTVEVAAKARAARVKAAMQANPNFDASDFQKAGSLGTTALYLTTMWDDEAKAAPKAWVKSLFQYERIPYLEGFVKPANVRTGEFLGGMFAAVSAVQV